MGEEAEAGGFDGAKVADAARGFDDAKVAAAETVSVVAAAGQPLGGGAGNTWDATGMGGAEGAQDVAGVGRADGAANVDFAGGIEIAASELDAQLLSRLEVIEQAPLAGRASSYVALHDDLLRELGGASGTSGVSPAVPVGPGSE